MAFNDKEYQFTNITSATTTQVFTGRGLLHAIVVNETAAGSIIIANSTTTTTPTVGTLKASIAEGVYELDVVMSAGCRIVTAGASNITVIWAQP